MFPVSTNNLVPVCVSPAVSSIPVQIYGPRHSSPDPHLSFNSPRPPNVGPIPGHLMSVPPPPLGPNVRLFTPTVPGTAIPWGAGAFQGFPTPSVPAPIMQQSPMPAAMCPPHPSNPPIQQSVSQNLIQLGPPPVNCEPQGQASRVSDGSKPKRKRSRWDGNDGNPSQELVKNIGEKDRPRSNENQQSFQNYKQDHRYRSNVDNFKDCQTEGHTKVHKHRHEGYKHDRSSKHASRHRSRSGTVIREDCKDSDYNNRSYGNQGNSNNRSVHSEEREEGYLSDSDSNSRDNQQSGKRHSRPIGHMDRHSRHNEARKKHKDNAYQSGSRKPSDQEGYYSDDWEEQTYKEDFRRSDDEGGISYQRGRSQKYDGRVSNQRGRSQEYDGRVSNQRGRSQEYDGRVSNQRGRSQEYDGRVSNQRGRSQDYDSADSYESGRLYEYENWNSDERAGSDFERGSSKCTRRASEQKRRKSIRELPHPRGTVRNTREDSIRGRETDLREGSIRGALLRDDRMDTSHRKGKTLRENRLNKRGDRETILKDDRIRGPVLREDRVADRIGKHTVLREDRVDDRVYKGTVLREDRYRGADLRDDRVHEERGNGPVLRDDRRGGTLLIDDRLDVSRERSAVLREDRLRGAVARDDRIDKHQRQETKLVDDRRGVVLRDDKERRTVLRDDRERRTVLREDRLDERRDEFLVRGAVLREDRAVESLARGTMLRGDRAKGAILIEDDDIYERGAMIKEDRIRGAILREDIEDENRGKGTVLREDMSRRAFLKEDMVVESHGRRTVLREDRTTKTSLKDDRLDKVRIRGSVTTQDRVQRKKRDSQETLRRNDKIKVAAPRENRMSERKERETVLREDSARGAVLREDFDRGAVLRQDDRGAVLREDSGRGAVLREDSGRGAVLREDSGRGAVLREDSGRGTVLREDIGRGAVLRQESGKGAVLREDSGRRTVLREDFDRGSVLREESGRGAVLREDFDRGSVLREESGRGAVLREESGRGAVLREDIGRGAVLREDSGRGAVLREDIGRGAVLREDSGRGAVLREDIGRGAVLREDSGRGAVLREDFDRGAVLREDIGRGAVHREDIGRGAVLREDFDRGAVLRQESGRGAVLREDTGRGAVLREDRGDTCVGRNTFRNHIVDERQAIWAKLKKDNRLRVASIKKAKMGTVRSMKSSHRGTIVPKHKTEDKSMEHNYGDQLTDRNRAYSSTSNSGDKGVRRDGSHQTRTRMNNTGVKGEGHSIGGQRQLTEERGYVEKNHSTSSMNHPRGNRGQGDAAILKVKGQVDRGHLHGDGGHTATDRGHIGTGVDIRGKSQDRKERSSPAQRSGVNKRSRSSSETEESRINGPPRFKRQRMEDIVEDPQIQCVRSGSPILLDDESGGQDAESVAAWVRCSAADLYFRKDPKTGNLETTKRMQDLEKKFNQHLVQRASRTKAGQEPYDKPVRKPKLSFKHTCKGHQPGHCHKGKCKKEKESTPSSSSSSSSSETDDSDTDNEEEEWWMETVRHKEGNPYRLHKDLWYNEHGELNYGPLCRCSAKCKKFGIRHDIYPGEKPLPKCSRTSNNLDKLFHYKITVSPVTNFLTKHPTIINFDGHEYIFEGFSIFSHKPIPKLPPCQVIRFNIVYTIHIIEEQAPENFSVESLDLFGDFLFSEILELVDMDWKGPGGEDNCRRFHLMPRFSRPFPENGKEVLSMNDVFLYLMKASKPIIEQTELSSFIQLDQDRWQHFVDGFRHMVVTKPGMRPSAIRIDQLDKQDCTSDNVLRYPLIIHHGNRPTQLSYAGDNTYRKKWKEYLKFKHLLWSRTKVTPKDKDKLDELEAELHKIRSKFTMKKEVSIEISSEGFLLTGIRADICQHAMMLPVLFNHVRFHESITEFEKGINYTFKDKSLIQLALTHASYKVNYGTNPDHGRNSMYNCGSRHLELGDIKIHHQHTRKRGLNILLRIMSKMPKKQEERSEIPHNERLEFLGDAVVEFITSIHLFYMFPQADEGELTMYRGALVRNAHFSILAEKLGLHEYLLYAHGSDLCHEGDLKHAMANCFEAMLGALYLDGGIEVADRVFTNVLFEEEDLLDIWKHLPKHQLQMEEPKGDRHWIDSSPALKKLVTFENDIGYEFYNIRLLAKAFTQRSVGYNRLTHGHNQRLEFLGDTVMQLISSDYLFRHFPDHHEGHLTLLRSSLVNNKTQSMVADDIGMSTYVLKHEDISLMKQKEKADLLEALLGAMYVDGGIEPCTTLCNVCFFPKLELFIMNQDWNDPKSQLQQSCLTLRDTSDEYPDIPVYKVLNASGPTNSRKFKVAVYFRGKRLAVAEGRSIQQGEMTAADLALKNNKDMFNVKFRARMGMK